MLGLSDVLNQLLYFLDDSAINAVTPEGIVKMVSTFILKSKCEIPNHHFVQKSLVLMFFLLLGYLDLSTSTCAICEIRYFYAQLY